MVTLVISGLEDGDKLIASLTYLASRLRKAHVVTKLEHRFVPRKRMEIHRVKKRSVQVEDRGFFHVVSSIVDHSMRRGISIATKCNGCAFFVGSATPPGAL
jgi:hypothetical protein